MSNRSAYERTQLVEAMLGKIIAWALWLALFPEILFCRGWQLVGAFLLTFLFATMAAVCENRAESNLKQIHEDRLLLGSE